MSKRLLCDELPQPGRPTLLSSSEADHAIKVLRLGDGDQVQILNGEGLATLATLKIQNKQVSLIYKEKLNLHFGRLPIFLEMAVLKGEAMEWVIEKAVELGVHTLIPVFTKNTVIQIGKKDPKDFQIRWKKIADQALKQCGRTMRMQVEVPHSFENLLHEKPSSTSSPRLWFDEILSEEKNTQDELLHWIQRKCSSFQSIRLLIGPEGGWDPRERELLQRTESDSCFRLSLGPLVLRAETAALSAISLVSSAMRQHGILDTNP